MQHPFPSIVAQTATREQQKDPSQEQQQQDCSLSVAIRTTLLAKEPIQSLRHAPHRLGPPDRPGRKTSIAVFSLRGDAFPAVVSLLLLAKDIKLNPGPNCYTFRRPIRRGMDYLQCQATSCTQATSRQRLPPVSADQRMEMSPTWGPRPV